MIDSNESIDEIDHKVSQFLSENDQKDIESQDSQRSLQSQGPINSDSNPINSDLSFLARRTGQNSRSYPRPSNLIVYNLRNSEKETKIKTAAKLLENMIDDTKNANINVILLDGLKLASLLSTLKYIGIDINIKIHRDMHQH